MARPRNQIPNLKWDKSRQQFVVYINRKRVPLGSDRLHAERQRLALASASEDTDASVARGTLTVAEALEIYGAHAKSRYAKREYHRRKTAIDAAVEVCGTMPADQFRARALASVRDALVARGTLCRRYINHLIASLKGAVAWLVSEEAIPADCLASVRSVRALEHGKAPDRPKRQPVDAETVAATIQHCSPCVAAMVQVQRLTGMRPGELVIMRRCDVSTLPEQRLDCAGKPVAAIQIDGRSIWFYVPMRHKNAHRGKLRAIAIGPEAQCLLAPWLMAAEPTAYIFRPAESIAGTRGARCCKPGPHYTVGSYSRAVYRAVRRAGVATWCIYSLRHAAAEVADTTMGAGASGDMLGHAASRRALDSYLQGSMERAARVASKVG